MSPTTQDRRLKMRAKISNVDVAAKLGVQHTTVSRWRSGDRTPSLAQMLKIADEFDWALELQALSWKLNVYNEGFEAALATKFGKEEDDERPTTQGTSA